MSDGVEELAVGSVSCGSRLFVVTLSARDRDRIEEERRGVARPAPRTLSSSHLLSALNALDDACSPEAVLSPRRIWPLKPGDSPQAFATLADITQRELCCTATLFAAFAAEGFVNDFLDVHLRDKVTPARFAEVDRWSTRRKYIHGVEEAYGALFREDDEVVPALVQLFDLRNQLVHARPGTGPPMAAAPDPGWRGQHPPSRVARWIVAVAGAAEAMEMRCYGFDYVSFPATAIWRGRERVAGRAAAAEPLPDPDNSGRLPLIQELNEEIGRRNAELGDVRLTVHELREARIAHATEVGPWDHFTRLVLRQTQTGGDGESDDGEGR